LKNLPNWVARFLKELFWSALRGPEKPFWQKPLQVKPKFRSSLFQDQILSKCSSESGHPGYAIYSKMQKKKHLPSSLLMKLTRSGGHVEKIILQVATMNV